MYLFFFVLRFLNCFSISDKEASLKENDAGFLILSLIARYYDDFYILKWPYSLGLTTHFYLSGMSFPVYSKL